MHSKAYLRPRCLKAGGPPMPTALRLGSLFFATMLALSLVPGAVGDDDEPGCVEVGYRDIGEGVGAYVLTDTADAIGLIVASGAPDQGVTMSVLIVPPVCFNGGSLWDELPPIPGTGQGIEIPPDAEKMLPILP